MAYGAPQPQSNETKRSYHSQTRETLFRRNRGEKKRKRNHSVSIPSPTWKMIEELM